MKKINKEVQKIIKDFKIKPSVLKEIKPISDEEFAKASFEFTIDLINYTRCCEEFKEKTGTFIELKEPKDWDNFIDIQKDNL